MANTASPAPPAGTPPTRAPRRDSSVSMVPLTEFGKAPPPPPRHGTNWRNVIISAAVVVLLIGVAAWWMVSEQSQANSIWGNTSALDVRTQK